VDARFAFYLDTQDIVCLLCPFAGWAFHSLFSSCRAPCAVHEASTVAFIAWFDLVLWHGVSSIFELVEGSGMCVSAERMVLGRSMKPSLRIMVRVYIAPLLQME
jgi:hypothetical protein